MKLKVELYSILIDEFEQGLSYIWWMWVNKLIYNCYNVYNRFQNCLWL